MSKKKLLLLCIGLILLVIVITQFVAVSLSGFTNVGGGCISVVFDKHFVCGADRIVVYEGDQVITITEKSTVRRIASEFVVANRTDLCGYYSDRRIEIYNGDKLVRSIRWNACCELAEIYEADAAHWLFPSTSGIGQVEMSKEFMEWLDQTIQAESA